MNLIISQHKIKEAEIWLKEKIGRNNNNDNNNSVQFNSKALY